MRKLEIIVLNEIDSVSAEKAGADRLELVSEMAVGGLSPSVEMVKKVISSVSIPVNVMVRFKSTDFVYDEAELQNLIEYINNIKDCGINGIVFGSLNPDDSINLTQLKVIIDNANGLEITFHRAIDESVSKFEENFQQIDGKVDNVLTSGGLQAPIANNVDLLAKLSTNTTQLLVGGGINSTNYQQLFDQLVNCDFHIGSLAYNQGNFDLGINIKMVREVKAYLNR